MSFTLDLNVVFQGLLVVVLAGIGRSVWSTSVTIVKLASVLEMHMKNDDRVQTELREELHDLRKSS